VERGDHCVTVGPVGSECVGATLFRADGGRHVLVVGCWTGTLDTLMDEVERRRAYWAADTATQDRWVAQYAALHALGLATASGWEAETSPSTPTTGDLGAGSAS
jgi:hypothetical protein